MYHSPRNLRFLLYQVHRAEEILQSPHFEGLDKAAVDMMLEAAKDFCDAEVFPYLLEMDEKPCHFVNDRIVAHPQLKKIIAGMAESGWIGATDKVENGGMGLPEMVNAAANHLFHSANNGAVSYANLTSGSGRLITTFGSQELIDTYIPKMYSGKWQGTMCLTEPQAGSSLSDVTSTAEPTPEGHYLIKGQKIFISAGDHDACDNFVHLLLARIKGAPAGTKGISLFVVPRLRPTADGGLEFNDVTTAGEFRKMGQRNYATTHLIMGEKSEDCRGWLVGEANKGLAYMFQMMNEARVSVGLSAISTATAAYHASLKYAQERPQGRRLNDRDLTKPQSLIIQHPDVRRMLFFQKAIVEGGLSLVFECARLGDLLHTTEGDERRASQLLLDFLTPIVKTYNAEYGSASISAGLQVLGGYGFTADFPLQLYYRDIRIMSIYEGTTGIQGQDLLGRKVTMENGEAAMVFFKTVGKTIAQAQAFPALQPYAAQLGKTMEQLQKVTMHLVGIAMSGDHERFLSDATLYLEMTGHITIAWQWLKQGVEAAKALEGAVGDEQLFYESKLHTLKFFYHYELPKTEPLYRRLLEDAPLTIFSEKELLM